MARLAQLELARQAGMTQFGDVVLYTPAAGGPAFSVVGVFSAPHQELDITAETGVSTTAPVLGIDRSDFRARMVAAGHTAADPAQLDTFVRAGVTWRVVDIQPDSEGGGLDLLLHQV